MTGEKAGFVHLCSKDVGHLLIGFQCIMHEDAFCAKAGRKELQDVMLTVTKIVNYVSAPPLNKRQFQILMNEID